MYQPYLQPAGWPSWGGAAANFGFSQLTGFQLPPMMQVAPQRVSRTNRIVESVKDIVLSIVDKVAEELRFSNRRSIAPAPAATTGLSPPVWLSAPPVAPPMAPPPLHPAYHPLQQAPTPMPTAAETVCVSEASTHIPIAHCRRASEAEEEKREAFWRLIEQPAPPQAFHSITTVGSSDTIDRELRVIIPPSGLGEDLTVPGSFAGHPPTPWPESPVRLVPSESHQCSVCGQMHTPSA